MDRREIERLYTQQGFDYRPTTADLVEAQFFDSVEEDKIKRRRLDQVIRMKVGANEYIVYDETLIATDKIDNELTLSKRVGKHEEPKFRHEWNNETRKNEAHSLVGKTTVYEIPFSKEKMQEIYNRHTEPEAMTSFLLIAGANARYGGFTADEFLNRTFDELLTKATTGEYSAAEVPKADPRVRDRRGEGGGEDRYLKEITKGLVAETERGSKEEKDYDKMGERMEEQQQVTVKEVEGDPDQELKGLRKPSTKKSSSKRKGQM